MRKVRLGLVVPVVGVVMLFTGMPGADAQDTTLGTTTLGTTTLGTTTLGTTTLGTTTLGTTTTTSTTGGTAPTPDLSGIGFAGAADAIGGIPSFTG